MIFFTTDLDIFEADSCPEFNLSSESCIYWYVAISLTPFPVFNLNILINSLSALLGNMFFDKLSFRSMEWKTTTDSATQFVHDLLDELSAGRSSCHLEDIVRKYARIHDSPQPDGRVETIERTLVCEQIG